MKMQISPSKCMKMPIFTIKMHQKKTAIFRFKMHRKVPVLNNFSRSLGRSKNPPSTKIRYKKYLIVRKMQVS